MGIPSQAFAGMAVEGGPVAASHARRRSASMRLRGFIAGDGSLVGAGGGAARRAAVTASGRPHVVRGREPPMIKENVPTLSSVYGASARPATAPGDAARDGPRRGGDASRLERPAPHNAAAGAFSPSRRAGALVRAGTSLSCRDVDWRAPIWRAAAA